jgi:hypothetical protein
MTVQPNISTIKRQAARGGANRRFQFHKRGQLFFGSRKETLPIAAWSKAFFWVRPLAGLPRFALALS